MAEFRICIISLLAMLGICASAKVYSVNELPNVQIQDHTKHFVNPDGIVSASTAAQIDSLLLDARRKSSAEVVAVIVDDIDYDDIDSYATELFNTWGIGKKDKNNGILLIVAKDKRKATIRTGYGAEGIMPDILAGRIIYDVMIPHFRDGDYEGGMLAGVQEMHRLVTDPEAAAELKSQLEDNYDISGNDILHTYLTLGVVAAIGMLLWLAIMLINVYTAKPKLSDYQKYEYLKRFRLAFWVLALIFVGIPALAAVALSLVTYWLRNHPRKCPHCGTGMKKLDEVSDNKYLNYAQDLEEKIKSVDYDVWLCPNCGEKDIYSFVNTASNYHVCDNCHARTLRLTGTRILREPTVRTEGLGEKQYTCINCRNHQTQRYTIAKKEPPVVIVGPGGGGRGGGFGGGSFGGGFGGGLTGGGGATGGW